MLFNKWASFHMKHMVLGTIISLVAILVLIGGVVGLAKVLPASADGPRFRTEIIHAEDSVTLQKEVNTYLDSLGTCSRNINVSISTTDHALHAAITSENTC